MRWENWHKHTHYSNIMTPDCVIKPIDIAKRTVELGGKTMTTVEHGGFGNIFEYYEVAQKHNLKLIFGVEFYYVKDRFEKDRSNTHLLILAKNENGRKQLTKILSEANQTGFYGKGRIDKSLVLSLNPKDVVVTSTCVSSYVNRFDDYEEEFIIPFMNHFKDNFYLEIQSHLDIMQINYNKKILDIHNKFNIPFVVCQDTHYIFPQDKIYRDILLEGKGIKYDDDEGEGFILDFPTSDQIFERFEKQGVFTRKQIEEGMRNTLIVDDFEGVTINKDIKMPSLYPNLSHEEKMSKLKEIVAEEWKKESILVPKESHKERIEGIKFETDIIEQTKMEDYFLFNYEVVKKGKEKGGILTQTGRGSAVSFYLNKLLGFTNVDRFEAPVTLYPTRFMSKSRILETKSLPDIDLNMTNREAFVEATKEILGEDNCYIMIAYGTMKESASFRNLCRAKGLKMEEYNEVAKNLDDYANHPQWKDLIEEAKIFHGVIDSISPSPCAYLILDKNISEEIGLLKVGGEMCCMIDSNTSDAYKYLKEDFLLVTVVDIIAQVCKEIGIEVPSVREITKLVENDEKTWDLYHNGLTVTLNQTGSDSGISQIKQYKPNNIRELTLWVAGIRPSFASMKHYFLNRKPFSYEIKEFDELLKSSDNFVLFQEDIMKTLVYVGFEEDETYGLLKAIAKKKEGIIEPIYERFINGFVAKTGDKDNAEKVWRIIEDAVGYGFNSSHAYSVALDSAYGGWLKAHYPLEYYSTVFNIYENDTEITAKLLRELDYFGIQVKPIKFGMSKATYSYDKETNSIYKGLASIKYLNHQISNELYHLSKNKTYRVVGDKVEYSFLDLLVDIEENTSVNSRQLEILIRLDFFSEFGHKQKLLKLSDIFKNGKIDGFTKDGRPKKIGIHYSKSLSDKSKVQRLENLFKIQDEIMSEENKPYDIYEQIAFEKDVLGSPVFIQPNAKPSFAVVTHVDKKFTPRITLYQLKTGKEVVVKVDKKKFYSDNDEFLYLGDIIEVLETTVKDGWRKTDKGFEKDESKKETFLNKCNLLYRKGEK